MAKNTKLIDPQISTYITLDDISLKFSKLIDLTTKNYQILFNILDHTIENEKRLTSILNELISARDEAGVIRQNGIVSSKKFVIIDTDRDPGHMVKAFTIRNDGPNNIYVAFNAAISAEVDVDIIDVVSNDSRFELIEPSEDIKFSFNRNNISNIHILAEKDTSQFRAWLVW